MEKIVQAFDPETGQVHKDYKGSLKIQEVADWPVSSGVKGGAEWKHLFKSAEHHNNYHPEVMGISKRYQTLRYQTKVFDECTKSLSVFTKDELEFLEGYCCLRDMKDFFEPGDLFCVMNNAEAEAEAGKNLQIFELDNESFRCPDAGTLHALIPYVKRLVRLFPQIKVKVTEMLSSSQLRNRVYQYETRRYVEKIHKSALDFNPCTLDLREFLDSEQQICQLRMTDGDPWTGITKVYRVLQKKSCTPNYSSTGHYTILKMQRLLTFNRKIKLNAVLESMETPHLLMIACDTNQPLNDELENMLHELLSILKQKNTMKIILTTQSDSDIAGFIQEIASEIFGEGFITTDEQLT